MVTLYPVAGTFILDCLFYGGIIYVIFAFHSHTSNCIPSHQKRLRWTLTAAIFCASIHLGISLVKLWIQ